MNENEKLHLKKSCFFLLFFLVKRTDKGSSFDEIKLLCQLIKKERASTSTRYQYHANTGLISKLFIRHED